MAIKEFFKSIGQSVKKVTDKAITAIDETIDVQKLKYRISKKEEELNEIYRELGKTIVDAVFAESDFDEDIVTAIAKISEIREEIDMMNEERIRKEEKILCPDCGEEISAKCKICPQCGYTLMDDGDNLNSEEETVEEESDNSEEVPQE